MITIETVLQQLSGTSHNSTAAGIDQAKTILTLVSSVFSVAGACCIIVSFMWLNKCRSISRYIVLIMAFSDISVALPAMVGSIGTLRHHTYSQGLCKTQSFLVTTGSLMSFIWTAGLAQHMFFLVTYSTQAIQWGIGLLVMLSVAVYVLNIVAFMKGVLGTARSVGLNWCWIHIKVDGTNCKWMIWDGKLIEITMYVTVFIYYSLLYLQLQRIKRSDDSVSAGVMNIISKTGKIIAIPFVFVLARLSGTIVTLWFIEHGCKEQPRHLGFTLLLLLMSFFDMSQGWINFILYFVTTRSEHNIRDKMMLAARSIPYMRHKHRNHSSQNSCKTFNTSRTGASSKSSVLKDPSSPNSNNSPNMGRSRSLRSQVSVSSSLIQSEHRIQVT